MDETALVVKYVAAAAVALACVALAVGFYLFRYDYLGGDQPLNMQVRQGDETLTVRPFTYCWSSGNQGLCVDGGPSFEEGLLLNTENDPLYFDFHHPWTFTVVVENVVLGCEYPLKSFPNGGGRLTSLGPPGEYRVLVSGLSPRGDASWGLRISNDLDLPIPVGAIC